MSSLRQRIEQRVRDTICHACIYRTAEGRCGLELPIGCPILQRIDKIIDIVATTRSDRIDAYVDRLRELVCSECVMQDLNGRCAMRDHADCALDDYFVLLVQVVEEELAAEGIATTAKGPQNAELPARTRSVER